MALNQAAGLSGMLKAGTQHMQDSGDDANVVLRNIDACMELSRMMLTSSLGPQGRCKLVVNHLQKIMVTADCAAILKEVQVQHPAASLLSMTVQKQKQECGDATNFCLSFAGELLWQTALLIQKMTWQQTAPEIIAGYQQALKLCLEEFFPKVICERIEKVNTPENLLKIINPVLQSKQYGTEEVLAPIVADACMLVYPEGGSFPVASIRTVPILGAAVDKSCLIEGYVATRGLESVRKTATNCKIAVFASGIEASSTEAKGTVVMKTAEDLKAYNKSEELKMEEIIQGLAEAGIEVVISGGAVSDMAMHFLDKYDLLCLKISSKWELRRVCQAVGATALVRLGTPLPDEMGFAETVKQQEMGDRTVTVFTKSGESKLATIVLRAFTRTLLADLERAVDDGVQAVAQAVKDCHKTGAARLCYGGGCAEMSLSANLHHAAQRVPGLQQYAMQAFSQALLVVPRTLAENAGHNSAKTIAHLQAAHHQEQAADAICSIGIDIEEEAATSSNGGGTGVCSMKDRGIVDMVTTKQSALRLAVDTVITILKIDQIIMSKQAGGPKPGP
eukprot:CAMPEP_0172451006 /NCGR_PEP_ID=MMETSP1065-20121228/9179_1 /TAXON_ID=265537 /ORGANISM="Amphiprora paludosa, Strain CCMP125" /LENGTH=561 /DNA_ID=CAMNT_0013202887 /DNA_START=45 /DNA_END=1730 /DNA_ORIENTATION=+